MATFQVVEHSNRARIADALHMRAKAQSVNDYSLVRNMNMELDRLGYQDVPSEPAPAPAETTQAPALPETAVPDAPRRRGRPPGTGR
jgi:hypothetical protein